MKFRKKSATSKKNLTVNSKPNLYTMKKYLKTTIKYLMGKSTQVFTIIKYQKKVLNVFVTH